MSPIFDEEYFSESQDELAPRTGVPPGDQVEVAGRGRRSLAFGSLLVFRQIALGVQSGRAARSCRGYRLSIDVVGDVAGGEETGDVGGGAAIGVVEVAVFVEFDKAALEKLGVGDVADGDEDAGDFEFLFFAGDGVLEADGAHFAFVVGAVFGDLGVPDRFDFFVSERAVRHDFGGAQFVAAVDEVDFGSELGEEGGFFTSGVAAADDGDGDVAVEGTVAGRAGGEAVTDEFFFVGHAEVARACAGRDDDGLGFPLLGVAFEGEVIGAVFLDRSDERVFGAGTEFFGLGLHFHHELGTHDAVGKAGVVLDLGGRRELATGLGAGNDERVELGAGRVNR